MEIFFEVLLKWALLFVAEIMSAFGMQRTAKFFEQKAGSKKVRFLIGYMGLGILLGELSINIAPHPILTTKYLRLTNMLITPILAGYLLSMLSRFRSKENVWWLQKTDFINGYLFVLSFEIFRHCFAK
ncbi:MAG: hypothetical protein HYV28_00570 [Ignavibacteriales bacterium]|nr:hypothetical protein [Ignavibacteriales bacterium]